MFCASGRLKTLRQAKQACWLKVGMLCYGAWLGTGDGGASREFSS